MREKIIERARVYVTSGTFADELRSRIAVPSESPREDSAVDHLRYLEDEIAPALNALGFSTQVLANPVMPRLPALYAERIEGDDLPTVLGYGHGDVLWGMGGDWDEGRDPFTLTKVDGKLYGRGTVDNKGQHTINIAALRCVLDARGRLGFNAKMLIETGEETGSPGLNDIAESNRELLRADVLIASDGPRTATHTPTLFLGARGGMGFELIADERDGAYHSGNWGGLLVNPGIRLAHALATITDARGRIQIPEWTPGEIPPNVRAALSRIELERSAGDPAIAPDWGEPDLDAPLQVFGWCNFEVLAFTCGRPEAPVNAVPGKARAVCQLRYVVGIDRDRILPALREHLDRHGFSDIRVEPQKRAFFAATRTDPDNDWVRLAVASIRRTTNKEPAVLPNLGGSLPNEVFAETLGMPTVWVPHSHRACGQHAPNEHMLLSIAEEAAAIMAGLYHDIGEEAVSLKARAGRSTRSGA